LGVYELQLGKVYTTLTSSLLVLWWIYPIGEARMQLVQSP
jgi:bacteriorhodopsin